MLHRHTGEYDGLLTRFADRDACSGTSVGRAWRCTRLQDGLHSFLSWKEIWKSVANRFTRHTGPCADATPSTCDNAGRTYIYKYIQKRIISSCTSRWTVWRFCSACLLCGRMDESLRANSANPAERIASLARDISIVSLGKHRSANKLDTTEDWFSVGRIYYAVFLRNQSRIVAWLLSIHRMLASACSTAWRMARVALLSSSLCSIANSSSWKCNKNTWRNTTLCKKLIYGKRGKENSFRVTLNRKQFLLMDLTFYFLCFFFILKAKAILNYF